MMNIEKIRIIFNKKANTLDVWFDDPEKEFICEETGDEIIEEGQRKQSDWV